MVLMLGLTSCVTREIEYCPPVFLEPNIETLNEVESIKQTKPNLFRYVDKVLVRELEMLKNCP